MNGTNNGHTPVMLNEVLKTLAPADGEIYIDGTFGGGGYTKAILEHAHCTVFAIDRDLEAFERAQKMASDFSDRLVPFHERFSQMKNCLHQQNIDKVDGIVMDLGVSSYQIDTAERGFSFMRPGPLDMRMGLAKESAADVVNMYPEKDIADILYQYGDERASRRIAKAIVAHRKDTDFETTDDLVDVITSVKPRKHSDKIHPATKSFQALRIYVNDELGEIEKALESAEDILAPGGRLVIVAFHSLEDRIVKKFIKDRGGLNARPNRYLPEIHTEKDRKPSFKVPSRKGLRPEDYETNCNPRARSAILRYAIRTENPLDTNREEI